jgi:hypothetical protein
MGPQPVRLTNGKLSGYDGCRLGLWFIGFRRSKRCISFWLCFGAGPSWGDAGAGTFSRAIPVTAYLIPVWAVANSRLRRNGNSLARR